jgi:inorganic pyrophosphatase
MTSRSGTRFAICSIFLPSRSPMLPPLHRLPLRAGSGLLHAVVDTPKGSRNKYAFDTDLGQWKLKKVLPHGLSFPYDFGFLPGTEGEDGDPIDVLIVMDEPAFPGCVVSVRLLGVLEARQTEGRKTIRNDRLVGVAVTEENPSPLRTLRQLGRQQLDELEAFFVSYNELLGRRFRPVRRSGPARAHELVEAARVDRGDRD